MSLQWKTRQRFLPLIALLANTCVGSFTVRTVQRPGTYCPLLSSNYPDAHEPEIDADMRMFLDKARAKGPVAALKATEEEQQELEAIADSLASLSDPFPARTCLQGKTFDLVYSAHPGIPSGRMFGPFSGKVTQIFPPDENGAYMNNLQVGPLEICLLAKITVVDDWTNEVSFREARLSLFGNVLLRKEIDLRGGKWKYIYLGTQLDESGTRRIVRIMKTPRLFVLEERI